MLRDRNSKNFSFPAQLGILIGFTGVGMILASFLSGFIWVAMTHQPIASLATEISNPKYYNAVMAVQGVSTLFIMFLPVLFFAMVCYRNPWWFMGSGTRVSAKQFVLVAGILLVVFVLSGALVEVNRMIPLPQNLEKKFKAMEESRRAMEEAFININTFPKYLLSMFMMAVLPAIFEEFFFRAGMQNLFTRWFNNPLVAIVLTAVIFSLFHVSYYGFLVRFVLGVVLGYIFYFSGSIWLAVFLHFLFNGLQVTAMYVIKSTSGISTTDIEQNFPLWTGIPSLILLIILFWIFRQECVRVREKFVYEEPDDPNDFHNWIADN